MQERSFLVQVLLDMATGGGAKLEPLIVDKAGVFDAGLNKGYNPVTVASGNTTVLAEKGVVANHAVTITPVARVTTGWQDSKSVTGEGIGVSASELVSGTYDVSRAGSADVTNYQNVNVTSGSTSAAFDKTVIDAHTVRFTPKATVAQGWQDTTTVAGEGVDVTAGELVSGTYPVTASGEFDVSAYEKISVPSGVVAASATKGIVAGHTVTVTPKASRTAGFINTGETEGLGVNVAASELVSGTLSISQSGTQDVTNYKNISVPSGGHSASATKGAVSNHSVSVTPKSTATAGFVSTGDVTGSPINVSAGELVSGTLNVNQSGTQDVTNYENISVPSGGHTASATKSAVNNHSVNVTPKSTATSGFIGAGSVDGAPVSVSASELVSGTLPINSNGVYDVTNYSAVNVNVAQPVLDMFAIRVRRFDSGNIKVDNHKNFTEIKRVAVYPSESRSSGCNFIYWDSETGENYTFLGYPFIDTVFTPTSGLISVSIDTANKINIKNSSTGYPSDDITYFVLIWGI